MHCKAVARGAMRPLLVGDLPFGSYEGSPEQAVHSAVRLLKEGGMDSIKLEGAPPFPSAATHGGTQRRRTATSSMPVQPTFTQQPPAGGSPARVAAARAVSAAGVAVMGHVGLTPQAISSLGGFRPYGRSAEEAVNVVKMALARILCPCHPSCRSADAMLHCV